MSLGSRHQCSSCRQTSRIWRSSPRTLHTTVSSSICQATVMSPFSRCLSRTRHHLRNMRDSLTNKQTNTVSKAMQCSIKNFQSYHMVQTYVRTPQFHFNVVSLCADGYTQKRRARRHTRSMPSATFKTQRWSVRQL